MATTELRPALLSEDDRLFASFLLGWLVLASMVAVWARGLPPPAPDLAASARPAARIARMPAIELPPPAEEAAPVAAAPVARRPPRLPAAPSHELGAAWVGTTGRTRASEVVRDLLGEPGLPHVDALLRGATSVAGTDHGTFRPGASAVGAPVAIDEIGGIDGGRGSLPAVASLVPELTADPRIVAGKGCDAASLRAEAKARSGTLRWCYEHRLLEAPDLAGRVEVEWTIGPDGRATDAQVLDDAVGDEPLADCLVGQIRRWSFQSGAGCSARSVLVFSRSGG